MRLTERIQAYADKLLLKRRKEIDADVHKNIEAVVGQSMHHGTVHTSLMLASLVEAFVDRIRKLDRARMDSLLTAHEDAGAALNPGLIRSTTLRTISPEALPEIPALLPSVSALRGQAAIPGVLQFSAPSLFLSASLRVCSSIAHKCRIPCHR
jgi:hypothetical protein